MRIPSRLLAAIVMLASLLISGTARATSTHDWSGFYLGGTIGLGDFYTGIDDKGCSLTCSSQHFSKLGFAVGVTTGYNWTIGSHGLLGIEGDWSRLSASSHQFAKSSHLHAKWDWAATLRARAGLMLDRSLIYITGGIVVAQTDVGGFVDGWTYGTNYSFRSHTTKDGFAVGAGVEQAFTDHLRAKAEYLHLGLPDYSLRDLHDPHSPLRYGIRNDGDLFRLGLNYRF